MWFENSQQNGYWKDERHRSESFSAKNIEQKQREWKVMLKIYGYMDIYGFSSC